MDKGSAKESCLKSPKKRKYAGRVKRACENCKRAKRCCDDGRPCNRCLRLGIEQSCRDAQKKPNLDSPKQPAMELQETPEVPRIKSEPFSRPKEVVPTLSTSSESSLSELPWLESVPQLEHPAEMARERFRQPAAAEEDLGWADHQFWKEELLGDYDQDPTCYPPPSWDFALEEKFSMTTYAPLIQEVMGFKSKTLRLLQGDEEVSFLGEVIPLHVDPSEYDYILHTLDYFQIEMHIKPDLFGFIPPKFTRQTCVWLLKDSLLVNWNRSAWESFGYLERDLFSRIRTWKDFVHPGDKETLQRGILNSWNNGSTHFCGTFTFLDKNGEPRPVQSTFIMLPARGNSFSVDYPKYILACHNLCL